MPTNPTPKQMPPPPDVIHSDDHLSSGDASHSVTRPDQRQLLAPPSIFDSSATTSSERIHQKKGKRLRSIYTTDNPEAETDREISLPSSKASSVADESDTDNNTAQTPKQPRRRAPRSSPTFGFGESQSILQQQMASQAAMATNNAILTTVEILTTEVKELKDLVTTLANNVTTLKNQNNDLKQGQSRLELQIQRMGRQQRDPPRTTNPTEQATGANTQPVNNRRNQNPPQQQPQPQQAPPPRGTAPETESPNTWAKVARKGSEKKEQVPGPPKRMERTIVVHCSSETANDETNLLHMRDTINNILRHKKAPSKLTVSGIQWNRRGNLTLTTIDKFTEEELSPYIGTIKEEVEKFDQEVAAVGKQETWTKVIVHKVDIEKFADTEVGMKSLKSELETFNEGLALASTPRYLTRPEKRMDKVHSSCVIAMKDQSYLNRLLRHGIQIFGRQHRVIRYWAARPSDQCRLCQKFGHHYRRCLNPPVCGICADPHHTTNTHACLNCTSRTGCEHKPAKCANCKGNHRSNSKECEILQAIRNPVHDDEEQDPDSEMPENNA